MASNLYIIPSERSKAELPGTNTNNSYSGSLCWVPGLILSALTRLDHESQDKPVMFTNFEGRDCNIKFIKSRKTQE